MSQNIETVDFSKIAISAIGNPWLYVGSNASILAKFSSEIAVGDLVGKAVDIVWDAYSTEYMSQNIYSVDFSTITTSAVSNP